MAGEAYTQASDRRRNCRHVEEKDRQRQGSRQVSAARRRTAAEGTRIRERARESERQRCEQRERTERAETETESEREGEGGREGGRGREVRCHSPPPERLSVRSAFSLRKSPTLSLLSDPAPSCNACPETTTAPAESRFEFHKSLLKRVVEPRHTTRSSRESATPPFTSAPVLDVVTPPNFMFGAR